ncbi:MAG TPA: sigma-70 family RNA polymerase sigma factor [Kiloniellales bacterium]|nr:sigma-70 family RNA polymerase sigma factor [Kiloniellales bacterium]
MSDDLVDLDRLMAGDKPAWDRFVGRFSAVIYAAVNRRLGPAGRHDEAEDVAQEVFIRLCARDYRLLRNYDPARAKLSTWLTVIANSAAIDHLRRQKGGTRTLDEVPEAELAEPAREPVRIRIPDGLLSPRQALVLELLYQREYEVAEAAEVLGVDPQTVRSTHHKALTKLREHFKEEEP